MASLYITKHRVRINTQRRKRYALNPAITLAQNASYRKRKAEQISLQLRRKKYGTDGAALLLGQQGKCAICAAILGPRGSLQKPYLDHDHKTGKVRGWLCRRCNLGIGSFKDSPNLLEAAARYLRG